MYSNQNTKGYFLLYQIPNTKYCNVIENCSNESCCLFFFLFLRTTSRLFCHSIQLQCTYRILWSLFHKFIIEVHFSACVVILWCRDPCSTLSTTTMCAGWLSCQVLRVWDRRLNHACRAAVVVTNGHWQKSTKARFIDIIPDAILATSLLWIHFCVSVVATFGAFCSFCSFCSCFLGPVISSHLMVSHCFVLFNGPCYSIGYWILIHLLPWSKLLLLWRLCFHFTVLFFCSFSYLTFWSLTVVRYRLFSQCFIFVLPRFSIK